MDNPGAAGVSAMNGTRNRRLSIACVVGLLLLAVIGLGIFQALGAGRQRLVNDLLLAHASITQGGVYGFLPGTSNRLPEALRARRFTTVTVIPEMVSASRHVQPMRFRIAGSIALVRSSNHTNRWVVSRTITLGNKSWTARMGIHEGQRAVAPRGSE